MAFVTKTWKDRLVEFSGRRKLKNVSTNEETIYDVSRSEGTIMQVGDQFSAENMNNLEQRIKTEFDSVNSSLGGLKFGTDGDGNVGYYGADGSLIPFSTIKTETFSGFATAQKEYSITLSQFPHELICLKSNSGYGVSFPVDVQLSGTNEDPPKYLSYGYTAFVGLSVKYYPKSKNITFKVTDHTVKNGGQIIVNYI